MISYTQQQIIINGKARGITAYTVWFRTAFGLHANISDAIQACQSRNIDPEEHITAVPVALANSGEWYETL